MRQVNGVGCGTLSIKVRRAAAMLAMINMDQPNEDQFKLMTDGHGDIRSCAGQCYIGDWDERD